MVRFSRGKVIAFDNRRGIELRGESGPYLQYSVVSAKNIFQKLRERDGLDEGAVLARLGGLEGRELAEHDEDHGLWALVLEASRLDEIAQQAFGPRVRGPGQVGLQPGAVVQRVLSPLPRAQRGQSGRETLARRRLAYFRVQMTRALDLMGIECPLVCSAVRIRRLMIAAAYCRRPVPQDARLRGSVRLAGGDPWN